MYHSICEAIQRELDLLEDKYANGTQMSTKDLEDIDKMAHALKCLKTYEAMEDSGYTRDRSRTSGRYAREDGYRRY